MIEDSRQTNANGDVFGNAVTGNQIASVGAASVALLLQTSFTSTAAFGSFDSNRYYDRTNGIITVASTSAGAQAYTLDQWRRSSGVGSKTSPDSRSSGVDGTGYATYTTGGANLIANSAMLGNATGWSHWNTAAPYGTFNVTACTVGNCLRYVPGASAGTIVSPNFSVVKGQWYRLTLDLAPDKAGQSIGLMVRRGGGGSSGYDSISSRNLTLTAASTAWTRYALLFQATSSVTARDPVTGDNGARVDIEGLLPGQSVSVANMELVPITPDSMGRLSSALANAGGASLNATCPFASTLPQACSSLIDLANGHLVSWPLSIPAGTTTIVFAQNPAFIDNDSDGIADSQDQCPGTPAGVSVNAAGCGIGQR